MRWFIWSIHLVVFCVEHGQGTIWEFGKDHEGSYVISNTEGELTNSQKFKQVQIAVPACYEINYVRVKVQNEFTTPSISYMKDISTVTIHYKPTAGVSPTYSIIAKAVKLKNCGQNKKWGRKKPPRGYKEEFNKKYEKSKKRGKNRPISLGYRVLPNSNYYY